MSASLTVRRVLGDRPFAEIGVPSVVAVSEERGVVVVGGDLGYLQWSGCGTAKDRWRQYRVGVYGADDLRCRWVVESRWPVHSLALHPTLPVVAVGTGSYDGGYAFEGELLLVDLNSGRVTSALRWSREVLKAEWESPRALRLVLAPPDDHDFDEAHSHGFDVVLERPDWTAVGQGSVQADELAGELIEFPRSRRDEEAVAQLTALSGDPWWEPRRRVWDVHGLADGRVLACLDEVLAEAWLPDGALDWRRPDDEGGRQLVVRDGALDAWVNVERWQVRRVDREWVREPPLVARIFLADGKTLGSLPVPSRVVLTTRADGWLALRSTDVERKQESAMLVPPGGETSEASVSLRRFDLFNHSFPVRRSSQLLFLRGKKSEPWRHKWVVAVDPVGEPTPQKLFPLDWEPPHARHLFGGPGVQIADDLVHSGTVHDGRGLLPGNAFVVRRSLDDGSAYWVFTTDFPATALDGNENTVYVGFNSGELVALNVSDGSVRWRQQLEVAGQPVVPLSLTLTAPARLLIGTMDGRVLDCTLTP